MSIYSIKKIIIGEKFIGDDNVTMILEDSIFYGQSFSEYLLEAAYLESRAMIFGIMFKMQEFWSCAL